ncbi:chemotaxis protein CheW [Rubrivivax gelatinosus]|uniref:chemotaxis protein CheW n=1 Tax=Rubrivivax gelatinosus TaxID=28068 RepID=UPI00031706F0|nr:chemotaxis protein CheW [Rubrivivax gelatinosus]MBG6082862.1 purine-binding chemotaxis protein CheW [Rubrivivax gelatinosus]
MDAALKPTPGMPTADGDEPDADAGHANQFVTFAVAGELFAVPMAPVQEIIRVPEVAHLPLAPRTLDGLANLRGRVLPIINLRRLLGCDEREHDDATRALVINLGQPLGFVVDRVASVVTIEAGEIEPAESIQSVVDADYLTGVIKRARADGGHDMLLVVDFARLIEGQFAQAAGGSERGTGIAAGEQIRETEDGGTGDELRLVSFSVAEQEYALDIAEVQEIVQLPERVNELPNTPSHVLGVMSLRQRLLPLVSLRTLFGLPRLPYAEQHRIVVTSLPGGLNVGLVTDSVKEVLSVPRSQAEPMPGMLAADGGMDEFSSICRLEGGKRLVSIIATDKLLRMPAIEVALQATREAGSPLQQEAAMSADNADNTEDDGSIDDDTQVVIFRLGAEEFGVPIMSVQEIVRLPETLTRVPRTPAFVEGVINLRGTVLPVIDQRSRLGLPGIERNDRQRIMVYLLAGMRTGFIVDSVAEVLRIPRDHVVAAPAMSDEQSRLISRVAKLDGDKRLVMLIDPQHLLQGREMQQMHQFDNASGAQAPLAQAA